MAHTFDRRLRVADLIKHELARLLLTNKNDPRFTFVSISDVELSRDYSNARVFVTLLEDDKVTEIITALNVAAKFFRHELARVVNLRTTPKLHFHYDDSLTKGHRISQLLNKALPDSNKE